MYVPSGWYHQVHNMTDCISVNHNGLHAQNGMQAWRFLCREYRDARAAIVDLKDTFESESAFEAHVQVIMKANCGFDVKRWIDMLRHVLSTCSLTSARFASVEKHTTYVAFVRQLIPPLRSISDLSRIAGRLKQAYPECDDAREIVYDLLVKAKALSRPVLFYSKSKRPSGECFLPPDWRNKLSNFSSSRVYFLGHAYPSVEHGFQAAKYLLCSTPEADAIRYAKTFVDERLPPSEAKRRGGQKHMASLGMTLNVERWNDVNRDVMMMLLRSRWHEDEAFRSILVETGRQRLELVHFERSGSRSFWGGCLDKTRRHVVRGRNELGKMLMLLRDEDIESRVTSCRRIRDIVGVMKSDSAALVRVSGQQKSFDALVRLVLEIGGDQ